MVWKCLNDIDIYNDFKNYFERLNHNNNARNTGNTLIVISSSVETERRDYSKRFNTLCCDFLKIIHFFHTMLLLLKKYIYIYGI